MIARLYSLNKQFINLNGKLLALPKLTKAFIMNALGYGWDRNRAIDTLGNHNNALMGGYLLAASNTVISIAGILTTDTIVPLTSGGNVGTVTVNGTISFTAGSKYGAFEVYRAGTLLGRYCLTERQGLHIINQVTGGLPNGLLGGTTTTVWQKSNAFYCETNHTGYSISGTGWVTSSGAALTVGTIIPADPLNPTKCMAWVSGVQQDLQFVGKARNSVSLITPSLNINTGGAAFTNVTSVLMTSHRVVVRCIHNGGLSGTQGVSLYGSGGYGNLDGRNCGLVYYNGFVGMSYASTTPWSPISLTPYIGRPIEIEAGFNGAYSYTKVTDLLTGWATLNSNNTFTGTFKRPVNSFISTQDCVWCEGAEYVNGVLIQHHVTHSTDTKFINTISGTITQLAGVTTNAFILADTFVNVYNQQGYEIWTNGTEYQVHVLKDNGTRIITPAGYTLVETVTAGNMPSVADSRMSIFKYSLANSYAVRQSVPEVFDITDPCTPKLLTYAELSALGNNDKVFITELNGKITNIKAT